MGRGNCASVILRQHNPRPGEVRRIDRARCISLWESWQPTSVISSSDNHKPLFACFKRYPGGFNCKRAKSIQKFASRHTALADNSLSELFWDLDQWRTLEDMQANRSDKHEALGVQISWNTKGQAFGNGAAEQAPVESFQPTADYEIDNVNRL